MAAIDAATGQPRGFLRLGVEEWPDSVLFTLDLRNSAWRDAARFGHEGAPAIVEVRGGGAGGRREASCRPAAPLPCGPAGPRG
jgi:hypothetical protein